MSIAFTPLLTDCIPWTFFHGIESIKHMPETKYLLKLPETKHIEFSTY